MDFLGNPVGLFNDMASGVTGLITTSPDVVGLVRDVAHGVTDTTSKVHRVVLYTVHTYSTSDMVAGFVSDRLEYALYKCSKGWRNPFHAVLLACF